MAAAGRRALAAALVLGLLAAVPQHASAHAALVASDPIAGAELGASPAELTLSFTEPPEASLARVEVSDADGRRVEAARPQAAAGDPSAIEVGLPLLERGVYTVDYRVVSSIDGHATEGTFAFGVKEAPEQGAESSSTDTPSGSALEVLARWILLSGLVVLLGASVAGLAGFGGVGRTNLRLAGAGWGASVLGLLLLAEAQRSLAGSSFGELFDTPVGDALIHRALALAAAGAGLLLARSGRARVPGLLLAALGSLAAVIVHVEAGHAGAGSWAEGLTVSVQAAHFAAAGIWFGGLAALLLGLRGSPPGAAAPAVARFALVAAGSLVLVLVTGTVRAIDELGSPGDLLDTGYGVAILAKITLIGVIALIALRSRRRVAAAAGGDVAPLRRSGRAELVLAALALAVAALLGTLAPPVDADAAARPAGLSASGSDFATTVEVGLEAASDQPGANAFEVRVEDYDSGDPVEARRVSLRFAPLDVPGVEPTTLDLTPSEPGTYEGSGPNLAFDGRWEVTVLVEGEGDAVEVPLELDLPIPEQLISVEAIPGKAPEYTLQTTGGYIRLSPHPQEPGPSKLVISFFTEFQAPSAMREATLVAAIAGGSPEQVPLRRVSASEFAADVELLDGTAELTVVALARDGTRLRGVFDLDVPGP